GEDLTLAMGSDDASEVFHPDVTPLNSHDHGFADLGKALVLVEGPHHVLAATLLERSPGDIDVLLSQPIDHGLDRYPGACQRLGIEQDVIFLLRPAPNPDRGDALDRLKRALHLKVREATQTPQSLFPFESRALARKAEFHDRVKSGIKPQDQGALGFAWKEDKVQFLEGLLRRPGHVRPPEKLKGDVA